MRDLLVRPSITVCADFCQGDTCFSIYSRGRQCMTNCITFIMESCLTDVTTIGRTDMNMVLIAGDVLYKKLQKNGQSNELLHFSDLPQFIMYHGNCFTIREYKVTYGSMSTEGGIDGLGLPLESSLNAVFVASRQNACIVIFHSASIAIKFHHESGTYFVFDSHSRGLDGLCKPDGQAVLSGFVSLQDLCSFLRNLCLSLCGNQTLQQVQYEMCSFQISFGKKRKRNVVDLDYDLNSDHFVDTQQLIKMSRHLKKSKPSISITEFSLEKDSTKSDANVLKMSFHQKVSKGPMFVCSCCTQTWFRDGVLKAEQLRKTNLGSTCLTGFKSVNDTEWICHTCHRNLKAGKIPSFAVVNGMGFPEKPPDLNITELEERLISPRIPFMQLVEKPRGGQKSLRGNVVNVPSDVNSTVTVLPRTLADSETIQVKFKRKRSFKHSVLHEAIRPNKCIKALQWLLDNSVLFQNEGISLNADWSIETEQTDWLGLGTEDKTDDGSAGASPPEVTENQCNSYDASSDGWTEDQNFENRLAGNTDTLLHPIDVRSLCKTMSFAPGEGQIPLGLYQDKNAEYLSFPAIFCGQTRPENKDRQTPVHYSAVCKWELRSVDRRVACSVPNIFFKLKKLQVKQIQDKVSLAMRKCQTEGKKVTVGNVLNPGDFDNIVRLNEGYRVLRNLRGSPAYWESAKKDLFAMIRQLSIPTWFCSLSAAESRWTDLLKILGKLVNEKDYTDDDIENLTWQEKCKLIKSDPVTCTRYFNHRVQVFISDVLKSSLAPLGKIVDYFYRVEFQQRGTPHIHMLVWIENAPKYGINSNQEISDFVDKHSICQKNDEIPNLINIQIHRHAKTCRRKGKKICRFNFPIPPMSRTRVLEPLTESEKEGYQDIANVYERVCALLTDLKINSTEMSFSEFLEKLNLTEDFYIIAVRSSLTAPKLFLKRNVAEIRVNPYNDLMIRCWEANIDVQFILDAYACAAYIVSYISKGHVKFNARIMQRSTTW